MIRPIRSPLIRPPPVRLQEQELIAAGCSRAVRFSPQGDKVMRLFAQTATIENGFVWLPEAAPWLADLPRRVHRLPRRAPRRPGRLDGAGAGVGEAEAGHGGDDRLLAAAGGGGMRREPLSFRRVQESDSALIVIGRLPSGVDRSSYLLNSRGDRKKNALSP
jgi:hypothetical protein